VRVLVTVAGLAYPLLVYAGLSLFEPRVLVTVAGAGLLVHVALGWRRWRYRDIARAAVPVVLVAIVLATAALLNDGRIFLFIPALVNGAMLLAFARSLVRGPSMIETFARLSHPELPASRGPYLRAVTWVWCGFFAANIAISVVLALSATVATWAVYNGVVAYVLVGVLLGAERVYRYWRFRGYHGDWLDVIFRRVFPPPAAGGSR
jgi:uncharacterized membrane protein